MSSKRGSGQSVGKYGGNPSKKVKPSGGPDIPSSNFVAPKSRAEPQRNVRMPQNSMTSLPQNQRNIAPNPTALLQKMDLPDPLRDALGPNLAELKKFAKEKERREAEAKKRLEKQKPMLDKLKKEREEAEKNEYKPKEVTQDESGRLIDEKGNVINLNPIKASSLKVNINKNKEQRVKDLLKLQRSTGMNRSSQLFDPALQNKSASLRTKRKNNAFHFIEKGSIMQKAEVLRSQAEQLTENSEQAQEIVSEDGTLSKLRTMGASTAAPNDVQIAIRRTNVRIKRHDPIPDVEWWDAPLLQDGRKSYLPEEYLEREKEGIQKEKYEREKKGDQEGGDNKEAGIEIENQGQQDTLVDRLKKSLDYLLTPNFTGEIYQNERINNKVEHPASFKTEGVNQNVIIPTYLTKDERKKLRRKKRLEREKDKQEKIKLGLMKAPPPKLKYSNFMNIMKDEAVADPTKAEMEVRKAIAERLQQHLERNAKKKLTKDQKAEKNMRKLRRDSAAECRVAVFRVENLAHGAHKFKINMNAQQLALNGVCIIADKKLGLNLPNVIVVEGGPKAIKFYKKLMLRRVKWNIHSSKEEPAPGNEVAEAGKQLIKPATENKCTLVWEGVLKDHNFNKWKVVEIKSELEGRRLLSDRGVEFYWDRALTGEVAEDQDAD